MLTRTLLHVAAIKAVVAGLAIHAFCAPYTLETNPKLVEDGTHVSIAGMVVTAVDPDGLYVEMADRSYGIRVDKSGHGVLMPATVDVDGTAATDANGERYIVASAISKVGFESIEPVGMTCRSLGGGSFGYSVVEVGPPAVKTGQEGVGNASGLNNIGILVRLCGTLSITASDRASLEDGSGVSVTVKAPPGESFPVIEESYQLAVVTGISSCERDPASGTIRRLLKLRNMSDVQWFGGDPGERTLIFMEPDIYLSEGDGSTVMVPANTGWYIRFVLMGKGTSTNRVTDVLVNGVSLNSSFRPKQVTGSEVVLYSTRVDENGLACNPPQPLLDAGDVVWYRVLPMDGLRGPNTEITIRLRNTASGSIAVSAVMADGTIVSGTVSAPSVPQPRIGFATVNEARDRIFAYVVLPSQETVSVSKVFLDGNEVTSASEMPAGFVNSGVLPIVIAMGTPLEAGSYHVLECVLSDGRESACTFKAANAFGTMMWSSACKAYLAEGGYKSLFLNANVGLLDGLGKRWNMKFGAIGSIMQVGTIARSSSINGYSIGINVVPSSDPSGGGLRIETARDSVVISAWAQYVDGPDGGWIMPDELHPGDVLSLKYTSNIGSTKNYTAYLNDRQLKWWSGAATANCSEFGFTVALDQPGVISVATPTDCTIDSVSLVPDVSTASFSTDFSIPPLPPSLEESETGTWTVQNGACYHTKKGTRGYDYGRTYVRTIRGDYINGDWVYEVSFNRRAQTPADYKYVGLGNGTYSASYYGLPTGVYFAPATTSTGAMSVYRYNGQSGQVPQLVGSCGNFPGWGTERVRITKVGANVTFQVDFDYAGGAFTPDDSPVTVDLSDPYFAFLNDTNSRLFFGCVEIDNNWFDDFSVMASLSAVPYTDNFTSDSLSNYSSEGTSEADWRIDTNSGTLYLDDTTVARDFLDDLRSHYVDAWTGYVSGDVWQGLVTEYGVRFVPRAEGTAESATSIANPNSYSHSYYLMDEPDVKDYFTGLEWGIGGEQQWNPIRSGLYAQYLVGVCDALRAVDTVHPTILNLDNTYRPYNYFHYGRLADIACADHYYPRHSDSYNWNPLVGLYSVAKRSRAGGMPQPAITILQASHIQGVRYPYPEEERIMAYAILAAGMNGICYYWYNCNANLGVQYNAPLWEEIGKINREFKLLADYVGVCFPVSLASVKPAGVWVRTIAAGSDILVAVVMNGNFSYSENTLEGLFSYTPLTSAQVQLSLPGGFDVNTVVAVEPNGPNALPYTLLDGVLTFEAGPLELGKLVVISRDAGTVSALLSRWQMLVENKSRQ